MSEPVEEVYPHIARWVTTQGWIELGQNEQSSSFVRATDLALAAWMREQFGKG